MRLAFIPLFVVFLTGAKQPTNCEGTLPKAKDIPARSDLVLTKEDSRRPSQNEVAVATTLASVLHLANLDFLSAPKTAYKGIPKTRLKNVTHSKLKLQTMRDQRTLTFQLMSSNRGTVFRMNPRSESDVVFVSRSGSQSSLPTNIYFRSGTKFGQTDYWTALDRPDAVKFVAKEILKALKIDPTDPLSKGTNVFSIMNEGSTPGRRALSYEIRNGKNRIGSIKLIYLILENGSPLINEAIIDRVQAQDQNPRALRRPKSADESIASMIFLLNEASVVGSGTRRDGLPNLLAHDFITNYPRIMEAQDNELLVRDRIKLRKSESGSRKFVLYPHPEYSDGSNTSDVNVIAWGDYEKEPLRFEFSHPNLRETSLPNIPAEKLESAFFHMAMTIKMIMNRYLSERARSQNLTNHPRDDQNSPIRRFYVHDPYETDRLLVEIRFELNRDLETGEILYPPVKSLTITKHD